MAEAMSLVELGRRLQAQGYDCSEHPAFGGVTAGAHSKRSWHYRASGDDVGAIDINVPPPGDHSQEREMLEQLWESLVEVKNSLEQVIYRGRGYFGGHRGSKWGSYGHQTHLHVAASKPILGYSGSGQLPDTTAQGGGDVEIGVLRRGSTGPDVGWWQRSLLRHDLEALSEGGVDHDFGPATEAATEAIQGHLGVAVDGIVGPATLAAFRSHVPETDHPHNAPAQPEPEPGSSDEDRLRSAIDMLPTVRRGGSGLFVIAAQGSLQKLGFEPGSIDGVFGPGTTAAVERFQLRRRLVVDGIVGPATWDAFAELTHRAPEPAAENGEVSPAPAGSGTMSLSAKGAEFIARFEGFRSELYDDPSGHCTIGFGHLVHHGPTDGSEPDEFKRGISRERALELLRDDAAIAASAVNRHVEVPLTQPQFDALTSFTFNLGTGSLQRSTLLRRLNAGAYDAVPSELKRWNKAGGTVLPGLVRRRAAEGLLFSAGKYS